MRFKCLASLIMLMVCVTATAQETQFYLNTDRAYTHGTELFDEKNYLAAREKLEEYYRQQKTLQHRDNEVLQQNIDYYIAVCAAETNAPDAEQLLLKYREQYHETDKRKILNFYLGKLYYRNSKYNEAIEALTKTDIKDLNNLQIYDYRFMLGYSYFSRKKFTEARPLLSSLTGIKDKYYYPANYYYAFICFYQKDYNEALKSFTAIEDSKMYAAVIPYYVAQIYFLKKDYDKVVSYVKKNADRPEVLYKNEMNYLLAQVYFQRGDYARALPVLEQHVARSPKATKEDVYQLAYSQYKTGAYAKAIENFKQLSVADDKLGQHALYHLADCYLKTNQREKARTAFQQVSNMRHDEKLREPALYNYGKLSFETGNTTQAIESFESYLLVYDNGSYTEEVNEMLAAALVQTRNYDRAYRMMEKMKLTNVLIREAYQKVTYFRAVELYNDSKADEALQLCNKSLLYPINASLQALALYLKAEILYQRGDYNEARTLYLQFAEMNTAKEEKKGNASRFRAYYNAAYCSFKQKKYADAEIYFAKAVEEAPATADKKGKDALLPDLYMRYADCAFITRNYARATEAYRVIADKTWEGADYALFQQSVISDLQNRPQEKIVTLKLLLSRYPKSPYADKSLYEIAETELELGNLPEARSGFQNLIVTYPGSTLLAKCYVQTAVIDYNSGKKEQAIDDYKKVIEKFPASKEARESLDALKEIYVELGRAEEYFTYVQSNTNTVISSSEQDSLMYQSAENAWNAGNCERAAQLYGNYLDKFTNGYFAGETAWKKADCHIRAKEFTAAVSALEKIIQTRYYKYYEKALVKASGISFYELKDYARAAALYRQLYTASSTQANTYSAISGLFYATVQLKDNEAIIETADQLITSGLAKEADVQAAYYHKGLSYYSREEKELALGAFNRVAEYPVNEKCVESKYMVAKILYQQQLYKQSLDTCFKLKNKYASYEYWVVKTFVLMADNYTAQGNLFQAKATLESIVQNYEGDAALLNEARQKLEEVKAEELKRSKLMLVPPTDTLIMENDSILMTKP